VIRRSSGASRNAQRGVALITAVLMVALATILAVNVAFRGMLDQRRSATIFARDQAFQIALGAEAWAADFLRQDKQETKTDHLGEPWARPMPPLPVDGGSVAGRLEDLQGRFNLNSMLFPDGTVNDEAVKQLERILAALDLEPGWATAMADWIDPDTQPGFPDGAEDSAYTGESPPYLVANMPITRTSELMALSGFGAERYAKLKPFVTALPVGTPLNVCTAPGIVLDALSENAREYGLNPKDLANRRKEACFPTLEDLKGSLGNEAFDKMKDSLTESSGFFRATLWVTIGTTDFTLYSLLARGDGGSVRPYLRSSGTE
jgi:general secretion pathway protein K